MTEKSRVSYYNLVLSAFIDGLEDNVTYHSKGFVLLFFFWAKSFPQKIPAGGVILQKYIIYIKILY